MKEYQIINLDHLLEGRIDLEDEDLVMVTGEVHSTFKFPRCVRGRMVSKRAEGSLKVCYSGHGNGFDPQKLEKVWSYDGRKVAVSGQYFLEKNCLEIHNIALLQ